MFCAYFLSKTTPPWWPALFFLGLRFVDVRKVAWWRVEHQRPKETMNGKFPRHCEVLNVFIRKWSMWNVYVYIYMCIYIYIHFFFNVIFSWNLPTLLLLDFDDSLQQVSTLFALLALCFQWQGTRFVLRCASIICFRSRWLHQCILFLEAIRKQAVEQFLQDVSTTDWLHDGTWTRVW